MTRTMTGSLIDSHCHLDNSSFDADRTQVVGRAADAGVTAIVLPATHAAGWSKLHRVAAAYSSLYPLYGLHPVFLHEHSLSDIDKLRDWLAHTPEAVGVGECGLDQFNAQADQANLDRQMMYFAAQLEIARDTHLPAVIHARGAVEQVVNALRTCRNNLGMVHSYNGSYEQAKRLIDQGFMLGFGGPITYTRARKLRALVTRLPLDALLLETDSPDQTGVQHRGQRNEPGYLREVFNVFCELRGETPSTIAQVTSDNASRLFGLTEVT